MKIFNAKLIERRKLPNCIGEFLCVYEYIDEGIAKKFVDQKPRVVSPFDYEKKYLLINGKYIFSNNSKKNILFVLIFIVVLIINIIDTNNLSFILISPIESIFIFIFCELILKMILSSLINMVYFYLKKKTLKKIDGTVVGYKEEKVRDEDHGYHFAYFPVIEYLYNDESYFIVCDSDYNLELGKFIDVYIDEKHKKVISDIDCKPSSSKNILSIIVFVIFILWLCSNVVDILGKFKFFEIIFSFLRGEDFVKTVFLFVYLFNVSCSIYYIYNYLHGKNTIKKGLLVKGRIYHVQRYDHLSIFVYVYIYNGKVKYYNSKNVNYGEFVDLYFDKNDRMYNKGIISSYFLKFFIFFIISLIFGYSIFLTL